MATTLSVGCLCVQRRPAGFSGQLTAVAAEVNKTDQILTLYPTQGIDVTHYQRAQLSALHLKTCFVFFLSLFHHANIECTSNLQLMCSYMMYVKSHIHKQSNVWTHPLKISFKIFLFILRTINIAVFY